MSLEYFHERGRKVNFITYRSAPRRSPADAIRIQGSRTFRVGAARGELRVIRRVHWSGEVGL